MAKSIYDALARIREIQEAMEISVPRELKVKRAYKYAPDPGDTIETPGWTNTWTFNSQDRRINMQQSVYTVEMQLFVGQGYSEELSDEATAFMPVVISSFNADVALNGTVDRTALRGSSPTLARLERANIAYTGLELFMDLFITEGASFS